MASSKPRTRRKQKAARAAGSGSGASDGALTMPAGGRLLSVSRRNALRAVVATVIAGGAGVALHRHDVQARERHDLTAIGRGRPSVVQVHDPSCPKCRRLMGATRQAIEDFPGVVYRVADITTAPGRAFQTEHGVPNVTLLLFDGRGRHVGTVNGVKSADELRDTFGATFDDGAIGSGAGITAS